MTNLKENATLVDALGSCLRSGNHALGTAPQLLKRVLQEEMWREFITQRGDHVVHERFADFVTHLPLKGLGADLDVVRRIVSNDPLALDLFDRALQNAPYLHHDSDNIRVIQSSARGGTSKEYALRRLRDGAPELHARVLARELSAHAAMVEAGLRPPTFTIRGESAEDVARTLRRRLPPDVLADVARMLTEPAA